MIFARLEAACAAFVERTFALALPAALEPVVIARKLVAAFEASAGSNGRAGRRFIVHMSPADHARFEPDRAYLERQWTSMLGGLAERSRTPERRPQVAAEADPAVANGTVIVTQEMLSEPARLALHVRKGVPANGRLVLDRTLVIGREATCDLALVDARVSRRHLEISASGPVLSFRDLGSSNGTRLNGRASLAAELGLGDVLVLGDTELAIVADDEA